MKIQVLSDLHREFGFQELSFDQADLIVLAGDVDLGVKGIQWMLDELPQIPIVYVLGNHEYYKGAYPKTLHRVKEAAKGTHIHVLEDQSVVIEDITFHGATLWTDFSLFGDPKVYGQLCQNMMNDYKYIRRDPSYSKLRSIDTYVIHQASRRWLEESLRSSGTEKNVVVTHHAPSIKSVPDRFLNDNVSAAYASNLEDFILDLQPTYWIHGHTHYCFRYAIGETEVICNPHGYISEPYNGFDKELFLEL
ncbi:MAG TPA: phosphoesterase [Cytophagales bacterium]|nr:phosphoesterase [Cytophagales bacterium]HAA24440.1 phosphoesterase [Cytophagales bacterium]HAP58823.1 phosphoesterase [Cytophagales bacterium]